MSGRAALAAMCVVVAVCASAQAGAEPEAIAFLGAADFPTGLQFDATTVGGLSGITYDPDREIYYLITDDKSQPRFYSMRISLTDCGIDAQFVGTSALQRGTGSVDAEAIAFDRGRQQVYWSSEAEPAWIRIAGLEGSDRGEFALPPTLEPRFNAGLEGLTVAPGGGSLWAAMEEPGRDDGDPPSTQTGALTRLTQFDIATRTAVAQYAYPLDPIAAPHGKVNGLTALAAVDDHAFLTLERSYGDVVVARLYRAELGGADDVLDRPSLRDSPAAPMTKTLIADLSTVAGVPKLDNVEGIALGPRLPDGRQLVVLVSDNNFNPLQVTQILAFGIR